MSNSLKDQLLALGLAAKKPRSNPKKQKKPQAAPAKAKDPNAEISLDQAFRLRSKDERQKKERAIAEKRELERQRREINQKIQALIKEHSQRNDAADKKRNFLYKGRIRSVLATADQITEINNGKLGVVYLSGNYHLMPADKIEEISKFAPDHVPDLAGSESADEKDNPVPDDLIW
ncbi:MAG: DUF2058 family protein [Xanthomonadales bacterium]|nr:DUF2058 family protein [Xanthomonadales bacterium]